MPSSLLSHAKLSVAQWHNPHMYTVLFGYGKFEVICLETPWSLFPDAPCTFVRELAMTQWRKNFRFRLRPKTTFLGGTRDLKCAC